MVTIKVLMMLMVAAILCCSHQQVVVAREVAVADDGNELQIWPWDIPRYLSWPFSWPGPWPFPWPWPWPYPPPTHAPTSCSTSDKEKVEMCMFNNTSIDTCCPTFKTILGTSCPCYKYVEDLDNGVLITLKTYCDVDSPCKGVQVIELYKEEKE
ncbi:uncharacterized protein LOC132629265 [Lycium barbarum]|uniref:uncharacterized protein LOC132629265 n=1 Tax=Lycium barbarum TaxID=112863 RepID=UPI00293F1B54|nr:uncharacterized protein LOC132629265 [Lycium barbarum]